MTRKTNFKTTRMATIVEESKVTNALKTSCWPLLWGKIDTKEIGSTYLYLKSDDVSAI